MDKKRSPKMATGRAVAVFNVTRNEWSVHRGKEITLRVRLKIHEEDREHHRYRRSPWPALGNSKLSYSTEKGKALETQESVQWPGRAV